MLCPWTSAILLKPGLKGWGSGMFFNEAIRSTVNPWKRCRSGALSCGCMAGKGENNLPHGHLQTLLTGTAVKSFSTILSLEIQVLTLLVRTRFCHKLLSIRRQSFQAFRKGSCFKNNQAHQDTNFDRTSQQFLARIKALGIWLYPCTQSKSPVLLSPWR